MVVLQPILAKKEEMEKENDPQAEILETMWNKKLHDNSNNN
jgi:hypothetical protein